MVAVHFGIFGEQRSIVADRVEAPPINQINRFCGLTAQSGRIDSERVLGRLANRLRDPPGTKNPGPLAGGTGAKADQTGERDRTEVYTTARPAFKSDLTAWASACDEWFEALERHARIESALDILRQEGLAA